MFSQSVLLSRMILAAVSVVVAVGVGLQAQTPQTTPAPKGSPDKPGTPEPRKTGDKPETPGTTPTTLFDKQKAKKVKRAHHLAEKHAEHQFLASPHGLAFKEQLAALDRELNAVYEKYLNIYREDPATEKGKQVRAERDKLLQALQQKQQKAEADYENLKKTSPAYRAMVEQNLDKQLKQLKEGAKPAPAAPTAPKQVEKP